MNSQILTLNPAQSLSVRNQSSNDFATRPVANSYQVGDVVHSVARVVGLVFSAVALVPLAPVLLCTFLGRGLHAYRFEPVDREAV